MNIVEDYVQMQTLSINTDTGIWELASEAGSSKIRYAPTNSCDCDTGDGTFNVSNQDVHTVDETLACPFTNQLESLTTYEANWTGPTAPSNSF